MEQYLEHHGVIGQKWGVRRYQNTDGSLTKLGERRFRKVERSKHLQKQHSSDATKVLTKYSKTANKKLNSINNKVKSKENVSDSLIRKRDAQKLIVDQLNTRLRNVNDKTITAGKDYIVTKRSIKIPYVYVGLIGPKINFATFGKKSVIFR